MIFPVGLFCGCPVVMLVTSDAVNSRAGRVLSVQPKGCAATANHQSAFGYSVIWLHGPAQGFAPRPQPARYALRHQG